MSSLILLSVPLLAATLVASATPNGLRAQTLGTISFPTSGKADAQPHFIRGVLYLHSFEYGSAATAFRQAQQLDPSFAMAYWGEAMTYTHPVWNEQDLGAARAALARLAPTREARRAKASTAREQAYLDAVEILYGEGSKERRDTLYSEAMQRLADRFADDDEAKTFYALSLIGLSQSVRNVPTYERAGAIAEGVFKRNPDHPGAAHYVIHAYDDPVHAPRGLAAAKAYSKIAPDAAHAQHMTTHIFVALGMWDDVVSQNEIASGHDHGKWMPGHYTSWLGYGYLQQGRYADARKHLETVRSNLGTPGRPPGRAALLSMRAHYLLNSERWDDPVASWPIDRSGLGGTVVAIDDFALGYAALRRGDRATAQRHLAALTASEGATRADDRYGGNPKLPAILAKALRATLRHADGAGDEAIALLREASTFEDAMPMEFGPPDVVKPTHELLGELLLALQRPAEAQREFSRALELAPKRALSLLGLARAARAAGDQAVAAKAYGDLRQIWHRADAGHPALAEASRFSASQE